MSGVIRTTRIRPLSWNRFLTRNLVVKPSVLPKKHRFTFRNHEVELALPNPDLTNVAKIPAMHMQLDEYRIAISATSAVDNNIPTQIAVESADVTVTLPMKLELDRRLLESPPNRPEYASDEQVKRLNALSDEYATLTGQAFEYWLRVVRWKSEDPSIGSPAVQGFRSGWSTYLISPKSNHRFWAGPMAFSVTIKDPIDDQTWKEIGKALKSALEPPLYFDYLSDSIEHSKIGELQQAVVELATSAELFIRSRTMQKVPSDLTAEMRDHLDEANIRPVMGKFFVGILSEGGASYFKRFSSALQALFNDRNTILHSGHKDGLGENHFAKYRDATHKLIHMADNGEYWK